MTSTAVLVFTSLRHSSGKFSSVGTKVSKTVFTSLAYRVIRISREVFGEHVFLSVPPDEYAEFKKSGITFLPQGAGTFGEKLYQSVKAVFRLGYRRLIVLGDDCPGLDNALLNHAKARFSGAEVVLGPDHKGGLYLLGLTRDQLGMLSRIQWNINTDFEQLCEACKQGVKLEVLDMQPDLDELADFGVVLNRIPAILHRSFRALLRLLQARFHFPDRQGDLPVLPTFFLHIRLSNQLPPPF